MRSLLFFTGFALLVAHELDAVEQAEWRLLPLLNLMPDDTAYVVFVALHVPLIAGLMWLTAHASPRIRQRSQLGIDAFLIIHAALHCFLSSDPRYTFHSGLSNGLIFGGGFGGPILFGYMLKGTGIWTSTCMFFLVLSVACLAWMHWTIRKMTLKHAPDLAHQIEEPWDSTKE